MQGVADPKPSQISRLGAGYTWDLRSACNFGYFFHTSAPADCSRLFHTSFNQSYYFTDPSLLSTDELGAVHCSLKYYFATLNASHSFGVVIGFITAEMQLSLILDAAAIPSAKAFFVHRLQTFNHTIIESHNVPFLQCPGPPAAPEREHCFPNYPNKMDSVCADRKGGLWVISFYPVHPPYPPILFEAEFQPHCCLK